MKRHAATPARQVGQMQYYEWRCRGRPLLPADLIPPHPMLEQLRLALD